jgi:hypothetical protein
MSEHRELPVWNGELPVWNGELLREQRSVPPRQFREALRRHLLEIDARARRPKHLWLLVVAYATTGAVLLIIAAAGVGA